MTQYGPEFFRKFADIITEATEQQVEKVGSIIKRVLSSNLDWEPGVSKLYKDTRRDKAKTIRVDDYNMKNIRIGIEIKHYLSATRGDSLAVALKTELTNAGYSVYGDVMIFRDQIMFQTRTPINPQ